MWHNVPMATTAQSLPSTPFLTTLRLDLSHIESGVPTTTLSTFAESSGLPIKDLYDVVIPARTLKHRRARREPLSRDESDKLARLVRIFDHAVRVFSETDRARAWFEQPKKRFANRTPLEMLQTEAGGRLVDEMLGQIEHGMFA
jgi:putative toxin-antitoxin system antitoxin component (TIGR02293 family)